MGPTLQPPGGVSHLWSINSDPNLVRIIVAKFGQNQIGHFVEVENVKSLRTAHGGRRTTTDEAR